MGGESALSIILLFIVIIAISLYVLYEFTDVFKNGKKFTHKELKVLDEAKSYDTTLKSQIIDENISSLTSNVNTISASMDSVNSNLEGVNMDFLKGIYTEFESNAIQTSNLIDSIKNSEFYKYDFNNDIHSYIIGANTDDQSKHRIDLINNIEINTNLKICDKYKSDCFNFKVDDQGNLKIAKDGGDGRILLGNIDDITTMSGYDATTHNKGIFYKNGLYTIEPFSSGPSIKKITPPTNNINWYIGYDSIHTMSSADQKRLYNKIQADKAAGKTGVDLPLVIHEITGTDLTNIANFKSLKITTDGTEKNYYIKPFTKILQPLLLNNGIDPITYHSEQTNTTGSDNTVSSTFSGISKPQSEIPISSKIQSNNLTVYYFLSQ